MALPGNLATDLRQILGRFRAANSIATVPTGAGKALEAWVLMRLAERARVTRRWTVSLRRGDGTPLPPNATFELATSQSGILPSNPAGPAFVLLSRLSDGLRLELHGSLQWLGRSEATHECDISVIPHDIAVALRTGGGGHPRGLPIAAFECKDRTSSGQTDEMRQTLARLFDLALVTRPAAGMSCRIYEDVSSVSSQWGGRSSQYRSFFARGAFGIIRVGGFSKGARRLGQHYHIRRHHDVYSDPSTIADIESQFMTLLNDVDWLL